MKIIGIDDQIYTFNVANNSHARATTSKYHALAKDIIYEEFPYDNIYEEVSLPGTGEKSLIVDFFIPIPKIVIEVQGEQHYHPTFFHSSKMEFYIAVGRDKIKKEWCSINKIKLIELPYSETIDEWRARIKSSR